MTEIESRMFWSNVFIVQRFESARAPELSSTDFTVVIHRAPALLNSVCTEVRTVKADGCIRFGGLSLRR